MMLVLVPFNAVQLRTNNKAFHSNVRHLVTLTIRWFICLDFQSFFFLLLFYFTLSHISIGASNFGCSASLSAHGVV